MTETLEEIGRLKSKPPPKRRYPEVVLDTAGRMATRWRYGIIFSRAEQRNLTTSPMQPEQRQWEVKNSTKTEPPWQDEIGVALANSITNKNIAIYYYNSINNNKIGSNPSSTAAVADSDIHATSNKSSAYPYP